MKKTALLLALAVSGAAAAALPDLPVPFKSGAGAVSAGVIYVGLGTAGTSWYRLDTTKADPKWEAIAEFTGTARDQAQAVALDGKIYVFGGCGKADPEASRISVLNDVYAYDIEADRWEKIMTRSPRGLTGHAVTTVDGSAAIIVGSVNKPIFDGYFEDLESAAGNEELTARINADYMNKVCADYFFSRDVLAYDSRLNLWHSLGELPTTGTAGSALAVDGNTVTIINGERKPGLRTAAVTQFELAGDSLKWQQLPDLIAPEAGQVQEGVAGAFAGVLDGAVIAAGGANFPGSTAAYAGGRNFAHQGCTKTWRDEVYVLTDGKWVNAGRLPLPLGYGVTVKVGDELLLIGGETTGGAATSQVIAVSYQNGTVSFN